MSKTFMDERKNEESNPSSIGKKSRVYGRISIKDIPPAEQIKMKRVIRSRKQAKRHVKNFKQHLALPTIPSRPQMPKVKKPKQKRKRA